MFQCCAPPAESENEIVAGRAQPTQAVGSKEISPTAEAPPPPTTTATPAPAAPKEKPAETAPTKPVAPAPAAEPAAFDVVLTKQTPTDRFGFTNVPSEYGGSKTLAVSKITPEGLLASYNATAAPSKTVKVGANILKVNDLANDIQQLRMMLRDATMVTLTIQPQA